MLLEAQFGSNITPIESPPVTSLPSHPKKQDPGVETKIKLEPSEAANPLDAESNDKAHATAVANELARLHAVGLYVPGVEIRADKYVAKVWLETLEVECAYGVLRDRVKAVVERAVETVAPLWSQRRN